MIRDACKKKAAGCKMPFIMNVAYCVHGALQHVLPCEVLDKDQKLFIKKCITSVENALAFGEGLGSSDSSSGTSQAQKKRKHL